MAIEVKQLVINSTVNDGGESAQHFAQPQIDLDAFKKELLAECKQLVHESLSTTRER
jgi:hypothetical protein